jgi:hypothetical protein
VPECRPKGQGLGSGQDVPSDDADGVPLCHSLKQGLVARVQGVDPMKPDTYRSAVLAEETETGVDAFVAAVIRTHERVQLNLRRLATERVWPADSADFQIIETFHLGKHR